MKSPRGENVVNVAIGKRARQHTTRTDRVNARANDVVDDLVGEWKREPSVNLAGVRPAGKTGHHVEFFQQLGDDVFCVGVFGESIEVGDDFQEGVLCVFNGLGAEVFALGLQAFLMFAELFPVKLGESRNGSRR